MLSAGKNNFNQQSYSENAKKDISRGTIIWWRSFIERILITTGGERSYQVIVCSINRRHRRCCEEKSGLIVALLVNL
jgi:hypothetical protein